MLAQQCLEPRLSPTTPRHCGSVSYALQNNAVFKYVQNTELSQCHRWVMHAQSVAARHSETSLSNVRIFSSHWENCDQCKAHIDIQVLPRCPLCVCLHFSESSESWHHRNPLSITMALYWTKHLVDISCTSL